VISVLAVGLVIIALVRYRPRRSRPGDTEVRSSEAWRVIDPVVGSEWVREQGDRVVLATSAGISTGRSGARAAYESGHLPGAGVRGS
jgi:hypothetical protein